MTRYNREVKSNDRFLGIPRDSFWRFCVTADNHDWQNLSYSHRGYYAGRKSIARIAAILNPDTSRVPIKTARRTSRPHLISGGVN